MYKIIRRENLNRDVILMEIEALEVALKAKAGQFIILRVDEYGERIPLTIADKDIQKGTVSIIFQIVGLTTKKLNQLNEGDYILDFVGPLGNPSQIEGLKKVCIVGGGVGSAISYPLAKTMFLEGVHIDVILGFRNKELIILEDKFLNYSNSLQVMTDDGSNGNKGLVTDALDKLLQTNKYDQVFAIGPLSMMKYVTLCANKYAQSVIVSMNPVMIDGTGMCGGCRITVDGKQKFACVDGPEFYGVSIDFDEAISRNKIYQELEREKVCRMINYEK